MSSDTDALRELTDEEFAEIEKLAGMGWNLRKIAMYLGCSYTSFRRLYDNCPDIEPGTIRYHYDRGILLVQATVDQQIVDKASEGNLTAIQIYEKKQAENKIRDLKTDILHGNR